MWVVETPVNRRAAEARWAVDAGDQTHSVTIFTHYEGESIELCAVRLLPVIDEHHGLREGWASDVVLEVFGVTLTIRLRSALKNLGRFDILERPDGFVATRTITAQ